GRVPGVRIDLSDELPALRAVVLDECYRPRQRAAVAVEQALCERRVGHCERNDRRAIRLDWMEQLLADPGAKPSAETPAAALRRVPDPLRGGPLALARFMRANRMLTPGYARLLARFALLKLRYRRRLQTDGICFICPGVALEIGRRGTLRIGRWAWV